MSPLDATAAAALFAQLGAALLATREVWEPAPFRALPVPWEARWPALAAWLRARTLDEIDRYEEEPALLLEAADLPEPLLGWVRALGALTAVPAWPGGDAAGELYGVSRRKSAQIERFLAVVGERLPAGEPLLDWCAGKGHLGRTLAERSGRAVRALERDPELCRAGLALAAERGVAGLGFVEGDALGPGGEAALDGVAGAVALHACGALTDALVAGAAARGVGWLALAPCCYWRLAGREIHTPLSGAAAAADLRLEGSVLRMACNEERTGPPRTRRERRRRMAFRLGLSLLAQRATGAAEPGPLPDGVREIIDQPFAGFCAAAARELGVPLPARFDPEAAEAAGWERALQVRALGLARAPFRRPLELWLLLDRVLFLAERGYEVSLATFCAPAVSPRNLLLLARKGA